ncbi:universal stress protein [Swingsia samuiensis]|uniref:Universal stress protein n=1 Tax=Swingsia samuiensis TaxID=1293412 RepID=A0A4Y6UMN9_9PROT|nr:universal stress protein [Swingsia samuiensis]QDH17656.1 universal stress protein [Swingsia samuiensis]
MFSEIKNILLPVSHSDDLNTVASVALNFAQRFHAHLSTVIIEADPSEIAAFASENVSANLVSDIIDSAESEAQECILKIRQNFNKFITTHNVKYIPSSAVGRERNQDDAITISLEALDSSEENALTWHSRLADMTLVPNLITSSNPRSSEILHAILFDSGRPLLIAPPQTPQSIGNRVAIGWNGTAEAALALRSILPWAKTAEAVQVFVNDEYQRSGPSGESVIRYLQMHNISASLKTFGNVDGKVGIGLLRAAEEFGADLLGMAAYSQSRLRQMFLGGVTRDILENMNMTVLMSR